MVALKGSSLIEVVVSMTIASLVFSLGLMIYLNVFSSLPQGYKVSMENEAVTVLDSLAATGMAEEEYTFDYFNGASVRYTRSDYEEKAYPGVWRLDCIIEDSLGNTFEAQKLMYDPSLLE